MPKNKVIIHHSNSIWNWEYWDNYSIPIYGKCFSSEKETFDNFKKWAKFMNIKKYIIENQEKDEMEL